MSHFSLPVLGGVFIASACAIWFAGIQLSRAPDEIDSRFGLGDALGGLILLAFATNLPEIAIVSKPSAEGLLSSFSRTCTFDLAPEQGFEP
jgi:cation:H+ antiporter